MSDKFFKKYFPKKYFENNQILQKSILKIQNKILFCIFKIKYYFQNTILHITGYGSVLGLVLRVWCRVKVSARVRLL